MQSSEDAVTEHHVVILWEKARSLENAIVRDLQRNFEIVHAVEKRWPSNEFKTHLERLYGPVLPANNAKIEHCGSGPFLLLVIRDPAPTYADRVTLRGNARVNSAVFDAKMRYRQWTGGGHRIHATDNLSEAREQLALLFDPSIDFESLSPQQSALSYTTCEKPLTGYPSWESPDQIFQFINAAIPYVVLRNYEGLPHKYKQHLHGDIDLLTTDAGRFTDLIQGSRLNQNPNSWLLSVPLRQEEMIVDIRSVADGYYDSVWAEEILKSSVMQPSGIRTPNSKHHFYSLLYHALIHKAEIAPDYLESLPKLAQQLGIIEQSAAFNTAEMANVLNQFMEKSGFDYTEPDDLSVHFNSNHMPKRKISLSRIFNSNQTDEMKALEIIQQSDRVDIASPELNQIGRVKIDLFREHFSPNRYHFLETHDFSGQDSVAVIGYKSSAIVRFLAEKVNRVLAFENHESRMDICKARCRDLDNITFTTSLEKLTEEVSSHDVVVLEIASEILTTPEPLKLVEAFLGVANKLVRPSGVILAAIPNARGFTYQIEGIETPGVTYQDLSATLRKMNFKHLDMHYAFPDARYAYAVANEDVFNQPQIDLTDWLAGARYFSTDGDRLKQSTVRQHLTEALRQDLPSKVAGSFVIRVTRGTLAPRRDPWLLSSTNAENRLTEAATTTKLYRKSESSFHVEKSGHGFRNDDLIFQPNHRYPFYGNETLLSRIETAVYNRDLGSLMHWLNFHVDFLISEYMVQEDAYALPGLPDTLLKGSTFDLVPQNVIMTKSGPMAIDLEWQMGVPIPLSFVMYRSLILLEQHIPVEIWDELFGITNPIPDRRSLWAAILNSLDRVQGVSERTIQIYDQAQYRFFALLYNKPRPEPSFGELYWGLQASQRATTGLARTENEYLTQIRLHYPHIPESAHLGAENHIL